MQRSSSTKLVPIAIIFFIVIIVIVAVVSIGRSFFNTTEETTVEEDVDKGRTTLLDVDSGNSVKMTARGPLVADENFQSYSILITSGSRDLTIYNGYLDSVKKRKTLDNNAKAYEEFVYALDKANYMKGEVPADDDKNDLRGICATGYVYEYSVLSENEPVKRLWTSTCGGSPGSLDASTQQLNDLYFEQIPDSKKLVPFTDKSRSRFSF